MDVLLPEPPAGEAVLAEPKGMPNDKYAGLSRFEHQAQRKLKHIVGYCDWCSKQTMVRDVRGRPVNGLPGTKVFWICLVDNEGNIRTRVGTFTACKDCGTDKIVPADVLANICDDPREGLSRDDFEVKAFKNYRVEVVKEYGI